MNIRQAAESDICEITKIFRTARENNLPYLPKIHSSEEELDFFTNVVSKENEIFVVGNENKIVGFIAFKENWLEHLYILPEYQNQGLGNLLLEKAKEYYSPLQLWIFQRNTNAIRFYEKHDFKLVKTTDGSGNEEKEPDALYLWERP